MFNGKLILLIRIMFEFFLMYLDMVMLDLKKKRR